MPKSTGNQKQDLQTIKTVAKTAMCLHSEEEIAQAIDRMAQEIHAKLADQNPLIFCVMIGGLVLTADLIRRCNFPLELDYLQASRYQNQTFGGSLIWKKKPSSNLDGRTILIVDDILDSGLTLKEISEFCYEQNAAKVYSAVLLDKHQARLQGGLKKATFTGLEIENHYVFGYGMDYQGYLRNAPGIFAVSSEFL